MTKRPLADVARELGRSRRLNKRSRIYEWLDAMDPPRTLTWLAGKCGRSRQSMADYITGHRKSRGKRVPAFVPPEVIKAVEALSLETDHRILKLIGGPITWRDWPAVNIPEDV